MGLFDIFKKKEKIHNDLPPIPKVENLNKENEAKNKNENIPIETLVVFLWASDGQPVKGKDDYVGYLKYQYNITNPSAFHKRMITEGYLQKADIETTLKSFLVPTLKEYCERFELKKTGKKADIIKRLIQETPINFQNKLIEETGLYSLSLKGKAIIDKNYQFVYLHKHSRWCISPDDYKKESRKNPGLAYPEIIRNIFFKRINQSISDNLSENNVIPEYFSLYELYKDQGENGSRYLANYLYSYLNCAYQLSRAHDDLLYKWKTKREIIEDFEENSVIYPEIIKDLNELVSIASEESFSDIDQLQFKYIIFSKKDYMQLLYEISTYDVFDSKKWNDFYNQRCINFIKRM